MAVTLAEALAYAWQSGPLVQGAFDWASVYPTTRSVYLLMPRSDRSAPYSLQGARSCVNPNSTTWLPSHAKRRQEYAKAWYLQVRSWQPSFSPTALAPWSHALPRLPRNAQAAHADPRSLTLLRSCLTGHPPSPRPSCEEWAWLFLKVSYQGPIDLFFRILVSARGRVT